MAPHCDTMDGPVVHAARAALEAGSLTPILPWVPEEAEDEMGRAFDRTLRVRGLGQEARDLAEAWFLETAVRLHTAGMGTPYAGLRPPGLDPGPVVRRAERAVEQGFTDGLADFLLHDIGDVLDTKFRQVMARKPPSDHDVAATRAYVQARLEFILFVHRLYEFVHRAESHAAEGGRRRPLPGRQAA